MTCVWGGFNWGQMLLHNNTGFSAAYEVGWGRDEAGGLSFGQSEKTRHSSLHVFACGFMVDTSRKKIQVWPAFSSVLRVKSSTFPRVHRWNWSPRLWAVVA